MLKNDIKVSHCIKLIKIILFNYDTIYSRIKKGLKVLKRVYIALNA